MTSETIGCLLHGEEETRFYIPVVVVWQYTSSQNRTRATSLNHSRSSVITHAAK